jgi:hypothetical protein
MKNPIFKWELIGVIVIVLAGGLLHFVFEWAGGWRPLAIIAAVNESTWEHLKLAFWPAVIWFLAEIFYIRKTSNNFYFAKAIGILLMPVSITVLFYAYTAFMEDMLAIDLTIFVVAVVIGQLTSYKLLRIKPLPDRLNVIGIVLLVIMTIAFGTLTYYVPELAIFRDPVNGSYGIQ